MNKEAQHAAAEQNQITVSPICTLGLRLPRAWRDALGITGTVAVFDETTHVELYNPARLDAAELRAGRGELLPVDGDGVVRLPSWANEQFLNVGRVRLTCEQGGIFVANLWRDHVEAAGDTPASMRLLDDILQLDRLACAVRGMLCCAQELQIGSEAQARLVAQALEYYNHAVQDGYGKIIDAIVARGSAAVSDGEG